MKSFSCILLLLASSLTYAQHTNFNTQRNWSLNKKEIFIGGGITQFTGDLGGVNKLGSDYKLKDLNWPSTGWSGRAGYRYRLHPYWITTTRIQIGHLQGNDALKRNEYDHSRNLHFRSLFFELSQRIDMILITNEKFSCCRYSLRRRPRHYYQLYPYVGLGLLYFNPQAQYKGEWVDLQPLNTEGQSLPGGAKPYQRMTVSVPVGIGFHHSLSRMWRIGFEAEYAFTFSDYLDDAGGVYYDQDQLATQLGTPSAELSNPSTQNTDWFAAGQPRAKDGNDGFFTFSILVSKNITYKNYREKRSKERESETDGE